MNELYRLAEAAGASPSGFAPFDPAASIRLYTDISGERGYEAKLSKAALTLYELLRWDEGLRAFIGDEVVFHKKVTGRVPDLRKPMSQQYRQSLKTLIHSLAHIASAPVVSINGGLRRQTCVAVPLDSSAFGKGAEYETLSATAFRDVVVALAQFGWIDFVPAHFNPETSERKRTRVRPTKPMFDWLVQEDLVFPYHPHRQKTPRTSSKEGLLFVSVADGEGARASIPLDRPLSKDEEVLEPLNDALRKQRLKCSYRDYSQYETLYDYAHGRPGYSLTGNKTLRRVFAGEDGRAGRLYGHWVQRLPKELRQRLTVGGKPMAELDYNGMQMALLYADADKPLPDQADLYAVPGFDRDDMKAVLLRTVGTTTRQSAVAALRKMLREQGRSSQGRAEALYDAFWDFHAEVCPHGTSDSEATWARLQELDSTLALRVLRKLLDKGVVAIPIHDSFLVEERHADATEVVMLQEFEALFGVAGVSVKRGY